MNNRGNIVGAFQFNLKSWNERLAHQWQIARIGRVNMLHQQLTIVDRGGKSDHSGSKNVGRPEPAHIDDAKSTDHIGDESVNLLKIADVVTREFTV